MLTSLSASAVLGEQIYGLYGNQRYTQGTMGTDKGYTGQFQDAVSGFDYYNARYYDPVMGQFLSADSVQGNAQGFDPYAYVNGNPETATDPTGQRISCPPDCNDNGGIPTAIHPGPLDSTNVSLKPQKPWKPLPASPQKCPSGFSGKKCLGNADGPCADMTVSACNQHEKQMEEEKKHKEEEDKARQKAQDAAGFFRNLDSSIEGFLSEPDIALMLNVLTASLVGPGAVYGIEYALHQLGKMASHIADVFDQEAHLGVDLTQQVIDADRGDLVVYLGINGSFESMGYMFLTIGSILAMIAAPISAIVAEPVATAAGVISAILPVGTQAMIGMIGYYNIQEEAALQS